MTGFKDMDGAAQLRDAAGRVYMLVVKDSVKDKTERKLFELLADRAASMVKFRSGLKGGTVAREGKQTIYWIYVYDFDSPEPLKFIVTGERADLDNAYKLRDKLMAGEARGV